jgi:nucleoside phosphorylase
MPRAIILTAILVEYNAVRVHLTDLREETHPQGTVYERGKFAAANGKSWEVGIVRVGAGNSVAAMEAERALQYFKPNVILFVGVAGGIKDVDIGHVVAATKVYGYESGKEVAKSKFEPRPDVGLSTYFLIQRAMAESNKSDWLKRLASPPNSTPSVWIAPIAAGEKVVASTQSSVFKFLQSNYGDAVAVEMEGRGLLQAAHANHQVWALVIRGISDLIDDKKKADAGGSQEIAAQNASAFAFEILAKLVLDNDEPKSMVEQEIQKSLITEDLSEKNRAEVVYKIEELVKTNKELYLVESELKSRLDPDVIRQLQKALDWLSKRDIIAAKAGEEALNKFPELTKNKFNVKRFYSEIERYLYLIYHSLLDLEQSKELLQAPPIRQIFSNPSIYVEALNTVKKRIPEGLNQLARQEIESRIDYLIKEIT